MSEKKTVYQANVISLPTLKMVLGEVPSPNPNREIRSNRLDNKKNPVEMESIVNKLITHLKKNK